MPYQSKFVDENGVDPDDVVTTKDVAKALAPVIVGQVVKLLILRAIGRAAVRQAYKQGNR